MDAATRAKIQKWITEKKVNVAETTPPTKVATTPTTVVEATPEVTPEVATEDVSATLEESKQEKAVVENAVEENMWRNKVILGNCMEVLKGMPDSSVTCCICDPPYGLSAQPDMIEVLRHWLAGDDYEHTSNGFMGKSWDSFVPGPKVWAEIMRVLKPGGHILSFSGTRTYDLMVTAMRIAGSEIRDKIDYYCEPTEYLSWVQGQGFPKSLAISKAIEKTEGRIGKDVAIPSTDLGKTWKNYGTALKPANEPIAGFSKSNDDGSLPPSIQPDVPFKYEAKASSKERNAGCKNLFWLTGGDGKTVQIAKEEYDKLAEENEAHKGEEEYEKHNIADGNVWPTVKPLELMRYLVRLCKMPANNLVLDPFAGSGSTLVACVLEGCDFVGIDMEENAVKIAQARIAYAETHKGEFK